MNFYKHHLGDYDGATSHLSWDEDMAYTRLLRVYYRREKPIAADEAYRLSRATGKAQRAAVDSVLKEFFQSREGVWHNKRADEEIAAYQVQAETNRRIAEERESRRKGHEPSNGSLNDSFADREPSHSHKPEPERKAETRRASRLPADWVLPDEWKGFAIKERQWTEARTLAVAADFRDFWIAEPGKDGTKLDWLATWRKWVRNQRDAKANGNGAAHEPAKPNCRSCGKPILGTHTDGMHDACWEAR